MCTEASTFLCMSFPKTEEKFLALYANYSSCIVCAQFWAFLEIGWRALEVSGGLYSPRSTFGEQSVHSSQPHWCTCAALCCAECVQKPDQGLMSQQSVLPPPLCGSLLHLHPVLSCPFAQSALINNPWLVSQVSVYQCLRLTH